MGYFKLPDSFAAAAAKGCFAEESSAQIDTQISNLSPLERKEEIQKILANSLGRGHGSVGDVCYFAFSIENLPRLVTLQLCLPEYLNHLQQSLRRVTVEKGYGLSPAIRSPFKEEAIEILDNVFKFYSEMLQGGIPAEDARFILPLSTRTNITTIGDVRELVHLEHMSKNSMVPSVVRNIVESMVSQAEGLAPMLFANCRKGYDPINYRPAAQLYAAKNQTINLLIKYLNDQNHYKGPSNRVTFLDSSAPSYFNDCMERGIKGDESSLANLKHVHFSFLTFSSLAMLHQMIRQRTWNISVEGIYDAVQDIKADTEERIIIPPSIEKSKFASEFKVQCKKLFLLYHKLVNARILKKEAIGVIPHALGIHSLVHIDGWNALGGIGQRTCKTAQWEIRNIATEMARCICEQRSQLGKWVKPKCFRLKSCPEGNKKCSNFNNWG